MQTFFQKYNKDIEYYNITKQNHDKLCSKMNDFSDMLLVFPLYMLTTLLNFKSLENNLPDKKPVISVINCGFLEYTQMI